MRSSSMAVVGFAPSNTFTRADAGWGAEIEAWLQKAPVGPVAFSMTVAITQ